MKKEKICKKCGESYPATLEYFNQRKNSQYGIDTICELPTNKFMGFLLHRLNLTAISVFRNCRRGFNLHKLKIPMSPRYCLYYTRNKEKYPFLFDGIHPTTKDARKASLRGLSAGFLGKVRGSVGCWKAKRTGFVFPSFSINIIFKQA